MLDQIDESVAFEQTVERIAIDLRARFIASATFYNRLFFFFAFLIGSMLAALLIFSRSALGFGLAATGAITTLLISYITAHYCTERREEEHCIFLKNLLAECEETFSSFERPRAIFNLRADVAQILSARLEGIERSLISPPIQPLAQAFATLSSAVHHRAVIHLRRTLLDGAALSFLEMILEDPLAAASHKKLSIVYLEIACLYATPGKTVGSQSESEDYITAIERAAAYLNVARDLDTDDPWILEQLIECYGALGDSEQQLAVCEELIELRPRSPRALLEAGKRYFEQGDYSRGLSIYEQLKGMDSESAKRLLCTYRSTFADSHPFACTPQTG
jgi:tetratricopeptide (TPR) repeat protein